MLKLFRGKLRSRFVLRQVFPSRPIKILNPHDGRILIINGQHLKPVEPDLIESINLLDPVYYD